MNITNKAITYVIQFELALLPHDAEFCYYFYAPRYSFPMSQIVVKCIDRLLVVNSVYFAR